MPGLRPGLERIETLLEALGNPEQKYPSLHIAGTNGKGSVTLILAAVLEQAGYRVGRFTSPHIHSYRERFIINGQAISLKLLRNYLEKTEKKLRTLGPSFQGVTEFEFLTAVAFEYFKDEQVDMAVLETGLGGSYDSTNVVTPLVSVITGVDYDHQAYLGSSLEAIALNKAGIIKPGVPVVIGDMDIKARQVIEATALSRNAPLFFAPADQVEQLAISPEEGQTVAVKGAILHIGPTRFSLLGDFQLQNLATAITAVEVLEQQGFNITAAVVAQALSNLKHPGRMELINCCPPALIDVAHNPQAARALACSLDKLFPDKQKVLVCGMLDDKDSMSMLAWLGRNTRLIIVTRPEGQRGLNWQRVADECHSLWPQTEVRLREDIERAVKEGMESLRPDEYLLVAGSFYILDRARQYLMSI